MDLVNPQEYEFRIKRYNPQVVFVLIGINDITNSKCNGLEGYKARLEELVTRLQKDKAMVILQTYNSLNVRLAWGEKHPYVKRFKQLPSYNQVIRDIAKKYSTILVDHDKHWSKNAADYKTLKSWLGEYIHPGAKGHLEMANLIFKTLNMYSPKSRCSNVKACNPFK